MKPKPDEDGLVRPAEPHALNIAVRPQNVDRALRIMDALVKAARAHGVRILCLDDEGERCTQFEVDGERIEISLDEVGDYNSRAELALRIRGMSFISYSSPAYGKQRNWYDGPKQRLEDRLNSFLESIIRFAHLVRADAEQREARAEDDEDEAEPTERQELARKTMRVLARKRNADIRERLVNWCRYRDLRQLIAAIEADASRQSLKASASNELGMWLKWARSLAERLDPTNAAGVRYFHPVSDDDISELPYLSDDEEEDTSDPWAPETDDC